MSINQKQNPFCPLKKNKRVYWDPAEQAQIKNISSKPQISNLQI